MYFHTSTLWGIKGANLILYVTSSTDFNDVSSLDLGMNDTHEGTKSRPPHLGNVATLTCESRNTENVILQQGITK